MLSSENKTYDWKKFSQSCFEDFQMTFLHLGKAIFCTLKIYKAIKKSGRKIFMIKVVISQIWPAFLKYEIKKLGQWCKFWDIWAKYPNIS